MSYNGWPNYETWCAHLWITNEEAPERHWRERAQVLGDPYKLALELRHELDEEAPEVGGLYGDLMRAALSEIDHLALAKAFSE